MYTETSPFPAVSRDLSVTVPAGVHAGDIEAALTDVASDLLESVRLFDVYAGDVAISAGYVRSVENDYDSHRITAGTALSLNQNSTTLSLRWKNGSSRLRGQRMNANATTIMIANGKNW